MSDTSSIIISISVLVAACAFVVLVIFLSFLLVSLLRTLRDVEKKVHSLDPLMRVVSKVGIAVEKRADSVQQLAEDVEHDQRCEMRQKAENIVNTSLEVAEWALIGWALWQKIKTKR